MSLDQPTPGNIKSLLAPVPRATSLPPIPPSRPYYGRLPDEILSLIISFADQSTLGTFMSVSKFTYHLAAPRLYAHIIITKQNADKLFIGLPRSARYRRIRISSTSLIPTPNNATARPIKLRCSDVPIESEDEEGVDQGDPPLNQYAYPAPRSEKRKLALFPSTRIITLTTRMPTQLCQDLRVWARRAKRECIKHKRHLFPKFETLIITGKCLKDCADWQDRHIVPLDDIVDDQFFGVLPLLGCFKNLCFTAPTYDEADYDDYILRRSKPDVHLLSAPTFKSTCSKRFKMIVKDMIPDLILTIMEQLTPPKKFPRVTLHNIINYMLPLCELDHTMFLAPYSRTDQPKALLERCLRVNKRTKTSQMEVLNDSIPWEYDFDKMIIGVPDAEMEDIDWEKILKYANASSKGSQVDIQMMSQLSPCPCCLTKEGIQ
ncbi:hypothetical protein V865_000908 [Kwoniella europaea PYCC6329]|uniref:F-box domain-containing protein n=1 Tax=Kwoniella europaea PYCC6329 TaxID=1423913 RepID=A0AAX4K8W8_9TREE